MKKLLSLSLLLVVLVLGSCGNTTTDEVTTSKTEEPLDLSGTWVQSNGDTEDMYQKAIVSDAEIEVYWVSGEDNSEMLYWSGSYEKPTTNEKEYSWESTNNKEKTNEALLASGDDTKTFTYSNDTISYKVSAMGATKEVVLKRENKQ